jgi:hypothetical protein
MSRTSPYFATRGAAVTPHAPLQSTGSNSQEHSRYSTAVDGAGSASFERGTTWGTIAKRSAAKVYDHPLLEWAPPSFDLHSTTAATSSSPRKGRGLAAEAPVFLQVGKPSPSAHASWGIPHRTTVQREDLPDPGHFNDDWSETDSTTKPLAGAGPSTGSSTAIHAPVSGYRLFAPPPCFTFTHGTHSELGAFILSLTFHSEATRGFTEGIMQCAQGWKLWHQRSMVRHVEAIEAFYRSHGLPPSRSQEAPVSRPLSQLLIYPGSPSMSVAVLEALELQGNPFLTLKAVLEATFLRLMEEDQLVIRCEEAASNATPIGPLGDLIQSSRSSRQLSLPSQDVLRQSKVAPKLDIVFDRFHGSAQVHRACTGCGSKTVATEPFLFAEVSLPDPKKSWKAVRGIGGPDGAVDLPQLIEHWGNGAEERVRGYCQQCDKAHCILYESRFVTEWPAVLIVLLRRFQVDEEEALGPIDPRLYRRPFLEKNDTPVRFGETLTLTAAQPRTMGNPSSVGGVNVHGGSTPNRPSSSAAATLSFTDYRYRLFAAIHHQGTWDDGFHSAVLRGNDNDRWYHCCPFEGSSRILLSEYLSDRSVSCCGHVPFGCVEALFYSQSC